MSGARKPKCRAKIQSDNGTEFCEGRAGHRGWHFYRITWPKIMRERGPSAAGKRRGGARK